jgi:hypothetical protein
MEFFFDRLIKPTNPTEFKDFMIELRDICETFRYEDDCNDCDNDPIQAQYTLPWYAHACGTYNGVIEKLGYVAYLEDQFSHNISHSDDEFNCL